MVYVLYGCARDKQLPYKFTTTSTNKCYGGVYQGAYMLPWYIYYVGSQSMSACAPSCLYYVTLAGSL